MESGHRERRQFGALRIPAQLQVQFKDYPDHLYVTINISQNGILVKSPVTLEVGELVQLFLSIPPSMDKVESLGRVTRKIQRDNTELIGIQFLEMDHGHRERWLEYMSTIEGLSTNKSEVTSSSVMLEERKKEGRNRQFFLIRFDHQAILDRFVSDSILLGKYSFPYTMTKTPGDLVGLVLVHPSTDRTLEIEAQITLAQTENSYDVLSLTFAPFTDTQRQTILSFAQGNLISENVPHGIETTSDLDQTVLMDRMIDNES